MQWSTYIHEIETVCTCIACNEGTFNTSVYSEPCMKIEIPCMRQFNRMKQRISSEPDINTADQKYLAFIATKRSLRYSQQHKKTI